MVDVFVFGGRVVSRLSHREGAHARDAGHWIQGGQGVSEARCCEPSPSVERRCQHLGAADALVRYVPSAHLETLLEDLLCDWLAQRTR